MARKTKLVRIDTENRDKGKTFFIKEMPATAGEDWALQVMLALGRAGIEIPQEFLSAGMEGLKASGHGGIAIRGGLLPEDVRPLMDAMLKCISFVPDPTKPEIFRSLVDAGPDGEGADIEEVATRLRLRGEVIDLHMGFSITGILSTLGASVKRTVVTLQNTPIAPEPSAPSSPPAPPA